MFWAGVIWVVGRTTRAPELVPLSTEELLQIWRQRLPLAEVIFVSANNSFNTDLLKERLAALMPEVGRYLEYMIVF